MESKVDVKVSDDLIKPIIEANIQAAIASNFSDLQSQFIEKAVAQALTQPVDSDGKPSRYSGGIPYIEYLCKKKVQDMAKEALENFVGKNREKIIKQFEKEMQKNSRGMGRILVDGITDCMKSSWKFEPKFEFKTVSE